MKVAVIGAGVVGITTAIHLQDNDCDVTIFTKDNPLKTNSDSAIAVWYAPCDARFDLQELCIQSLNQLKMLSKQADTGVSLVEMRYLFKDEDEYRESAFSKCECVNALEIKPESPGREVTKSEYDFSVRASVPLMDVNIYRPYLLKRFENAKGVVRQNKISSSHTLADDFDLIVNCSGWEACELTQDSHVFPARGQQGLHLVWSLRQFQINIRNLFQ